MRLMFYGATHEVTGSCTLLEACGKRILIDSMKGASNKELARLADQLNAIYEKFCR